MTDSPTPLTAAEEKALRVRQMVTNIISDGYDYMFERFDKLHTKGIHDDDIVAALRHYAEEDVLEGYVEWAEIDLRTEDNTTMNPVVPDPGDAPSYAPIYPLNTIEDKR